MTGRNRVAAGVVTMLVMAGAFGAVVSMTRLWVVGPLPLTPVALTTVALTLLLPLAFRLRLLPLV